jgi:hypothetical protein
MLMRDIWRNPTVWFFVAVGALLALLISWASGFPPAYAHYCPDQQTYNESCPIRHIAGIAISLVGRFFEWGFTGITAFATFMIFRLTDRLKKISSEQLRHNILVERSYLWPGFGKHELMADGKMRWFVTVTNTGRIAGVLKVIRYARIADKEYEAGGYKFDTFTNREDVIPPGTGNPGQPTGLDFVIDKPMVCCGWIEFEDIFGRDRRQGWKHSLRLTEDSAGCWSIPFPECYSASYHPWEGAEIENETKQ